MRQRRFTAAAIATMTCLCFSPLGSAGNVAINEIAWAGNAFDYTAEWIELVNTGSDPVDLDGWRLTSSDGAPDILLRGVLAPRGPGPTNPGYFLLERDSESAVPSRAANQIYAGALGDRGEFLTLLDPDGHPVDTANVSELDVRGWAAGSAWTPSSAPRSMERINPLLPDTAENWASALCRPDEPSSSLFCGTPGAQNSAFNVPPIGAMTIVPRYPAPGETVRMDAGTSRDESGRIVSFAWSFGDGSLGAGQTVSHTYVSPGEYEVILTLTDDRDATAVVSETLAIRIPSPPHADFSVLPPAGGSLRAGTPVEFLDESGDGSSPIIEHVWTFGDGTTAAEEHTAHTFESAGTYEVCLSLVDGRGNRSARCEALTIASRVPTARFDVSSGLHSDGEPVAFDASESSDPDGAVAVYHWDFDGDGTPDLATAEAQTGFAFPTGGYFAPCLVVEDRDGDRSSPTCHGLYVNASPAVQFSLSDFNPNEGDEVRFTDLSHDLDGVIVRWQWTFGDGEESIQTAPVHVYRRSGEYAVSLTVTDDQSASRSASATIDVRNLSPIATLTCSVEQELTGVPFSFDASASHDPSPEGRIVTYAWDFNGDGVFERETLSSSVSESFGNDGTFSVTVRVTDDAGGTAVSPAVRVRVLNRPPVVEAIGWDDEAPRDGADVRFSARAADSDGEIAAWTWTFEDEATSSDAAPAHVFQTDRLYTVTLTVRDDDGAASAPFQITVRVWNTPPIAAFSFRQTDPTTIRFDSGASFDPSPEGKIVHFAWDFGDGSSCPEDPTACGTGDHRAPEHTFPGPGTYDVTLVVIDDNGGIGRATRSVTIP